MEKDKNFERIEDVHILKSQEDWSDEDNRYPPQMSLSPSPSTAVSSSGLLSNEIKTRTLTSPDGIKVKEFEVKFQRAYQKKTFFTLFSYL